MKQSTISKVLMKKSDIDCRSQYLHEELSCYYRLFQAVISESFADAFIVENNRHQKFIRKGARHWLLQDKKDFEIVCQLAGVHPGYVRKNADLMLKRYQSFFINHRSNR